MFKLLAKGRELTRTEPPPVLPQSAGPSERHSMTLHVCLKPSDSTSAIHDRMPVTATGAIRRLARPRVPGLRFSANLVAAVRLGRVDDLSRTFEKTLSLLSPIVVDVNPYAVGTGGGTRTLTPLRALDIESSTRRWVSVASAMD
jgi:hypothetical protein